MKRKLRPLSLMLTMALMSTAFSMGVTVNAATPTISYSFSGEQAADSGYAQGTITFTAGAAGTYRLYWADDEQALEGYTRIAKYTMSAGDSESVTLGYHTVIPAGATKIIACTDGATAVSDAAAVYDIPLNKQLEFDSGDLKVWHMQLIRVRIILLYPAISLPMLMVPIRSGLCTSRHSARVIL